MHVRCKKIRQTTILVTDSVSGSVLKMQQKWILNLKERNHFLLLYSFCHSWSVRKNTILRFREYLFLFADLESKIGNSVCKKNLALQFHYFYRDCNRLFFEPLSSSGNVGFNESISLRYISFDLTSPAPIFKAFRVIFQQHFAISWPGTCSREKHYTKPR